MFDLDGPIARDVIAELAAEPPPDFGMSDVMTAREAARFLRVSLDSLYGSANRMEIPHRRIGRRLLFSRWGRVAWLGGAGPRTTEEEQSNGGRT